MSSFSLNLAETAAQDAARLIPADPPPSWSGEAATACALQLDALHAQWRAALAAIEDARAHIMRLETMQAEMLPAGGWS